MAKESYDDGDIIAMLDSTRTIAVVGASPDASRHSHRVMRFMQSNGYRVVPVNPLEAGREILGETVRASLAEVPGRFEMVDVFRRAEAIPAVAEEVLAARADKGIRFLWLQLDLYDENVASKVRAAGIAVVMDRCLKVEYGRLLAHWA